LAQVIVGRSLFQGGLSPHSRSDSDMAADGADSFPGATELEIVRYRRARPNSLEEAAQLYKDDVAWRSAEGSPENLAAAAAAIPPQFVRAHGTATDGSKVILVQGARYDSSIDVDKYVLACFRVLDQVVSRPDSDDLVTLLIDVRPHTGWPNAPAPTMFPFFKQAAALANSHPAQSGQLKRVIFYPLPGIFRHILTVASVLVDKASRDKFLIFSGASGIGAECPLEMARYVPFEEFPPDAQGMHASLQATRVDAGKRSSKQVQIDSAGPVSWNCHVASKDITLTVSFHSAEGLPPMTVCEGEKVEHRTGEVTVPSAGVMIFDMDNTHSWMTAKHVTIGAALVEAGAVEAEEETEELKRSLEAA